MIQTNEMELTDLSLNEQIVQECLAMAKHAFASGLKVPEKVVKVLEIIMPCQPGENKENKTKQMPTMKELNAIHACLSHIIEPAKPRTILLLDTEGKKKGYFKFMAPVPFIRRMVLASIISLVLFIFISLSPVINNDDPNAWNMFAQSGLTLLMKELFLLSAAALGAAFTALFKANQYIVRGTFDPKYESSYWIRFILGIIAGMILASLIPVEDYAQKGFGKPLLAMLGGFSANMVYQVINRLVETIGSLFKSDTAEATEANEEKLKARAAGEDIKNRFSLVSDLMNIQDQVQPDMKPEDIKKMLTGVTRKLTNNEE
ncbi:MAG TPA: hypothetical protein VK186_07680 [Candidatus Deferrimicrobium sp.]|nr:hypothetical protein [Candidatus Deferrimicrobium sp.]